MGGLNGCQLFWEWYISVTHLPGVFLVPEVKEMLRNELQTSLDRVRIPKDQMVPLTDMLFDEDDDELHLWLAKKGPTGNFYNTRTLAFYTSLPTY